MISTINTIADKWFTYQFEMFWQVGLLILIVWTIDLLIKKWAWPQLRYAMWLLILVKLIMPPSISSPTSFTSTIPLVTQNTIKSQTNQSERTLQVLNSTESNRLITPFSESIHPVSRRTDLISSEIATPIIIPSTSVFFAWRICLFLIWLAGIMTLSLLLVRKLSYLHRKYLKDAQELNLSDKLLNESLRATTKKLKLNKIPRLILTDKISCPAVFGILRPTILMPAKKYERLTKQDIEHIFMHELAHIKRGDLFVHAVYVILQILYWFNPLLWLIGKHVQNLRELCCDATVAMLLKKDTYRYRKTLLEMAKQFFTEPAVLGLGLMGLFENSNWFAYRLKWLEKKTWKGRSFRITAIFVLTCTMITCIMPMAAKSKAETDWSEMVLGLQCRLRPFNSMWHKDETPSLILDLKNQGEQELSFVPIAQAHCQIEVNGRWYGWAEQLITDTFVLRLEPDDELTDAFEIKLNDSWALPTNGDNPKFAPGITEEWGERLQLLSGKYKIRVRFFPNEWRGSREISTYVTSNPVEIEVLSELKKFGEEKYGNQPDDSKFDPVQDLIISHQGKCIAVNFDTNKIFSTMENEIIKIPHESDIWADFYASSKEQPKNIALGANMLFIPIAEKDWDITAWNLISSFSPPKSKNIKQTSPLITDMDDIPKTFLFKTFQGRLGVLQIIGFPKEPKGIAVRYKLLKKGLRGGPGIDVIDSWGEMVLGLQCRLRPFNSMWHKDETPSLILDLKNQGEQELSFVPIAQAHCQIEVNGRWYGWAEQLITDTFVLRLEPDDELTDAFEIKLNDSWALPTNGDNPKFAPGITEEWGERLQLLSGKYKIRVRFFPNEWRGSREISTYVTSNPVEIEVLSEPKGNN